MAVKRLACWLLLLNACVGQDIDTPPPSIQIVVPEPEEEVNWAPTLDVECAISFFDPQEGFVELHFGEGNSVRLTESPDFITLSGLLPGRQTLTAVLHDLAKGPVAEHQMSFTILSDPNAPVPPSASAPEEIALADWRRWPIPDDEVRQLVGFPTPSQFATRPLIVFANGLEWSRTSQGDRDECGSVPNLWAFGMTAGLADVVVFNCRSPHNWVKPDYQLWVYFCVEAHMADKERSPSFRSQFDLTSSYQLFTDVPYVYAPPSVDVFFDTPVVPFADKVATAAVYIVSNCGKPRDLYVKRLMNYMQIDSVGKCLNNLDFPNIEPLHSSRKLALLRRYKFVIAFENTYTNDYVTEKFYQPLMIGVVPVYLGAPNIAELSPCSDCYVDVRHFTSPEHLAEHLEGLASDEEAYNRMLAWRNHPDNVPQSFRDLTKQSMNSGLGSTEGTQHANPGVLNTCRLTAAMEAKLQQRRRAEEL